MEPLKAPKSYAQIAKELQEEVDRLAAKLAECEKEVERLKTEVLSLQCPSYCSREADARKQAARECIDLCCKIMKKVITSNVGCGDYNHSCAHFNELEFMKQVKDKFGLEG